MRFLPANTGWGGVSLTQGGFTRGVSSELISSSLSLVVEAPSFSTSSTLVFVESSLLTAVKHKKSIITSKQQNNNLLGLITVTSLSPNVS